MLAIIISDIHDNEVNLKKCLHWANQQKATEIICCGDVAANRTLGLLSQSFAGPIHLVRGNMDIYSLAEVKAYNNIIYYGRQGLFTIGHYQAGFCHEPYLLADILKQKVDYAFYGHTHKPWLEKRGRTIIINPGTLAGMFQQATFAVWSVNNGELTLKILAEI